MCISIYCVIFTQNNVHNFNPVQIQVYLQEALLLQRDTLNSKHTNLQVMIHAITFISLLKIFTCLTATTAVL